MSDNRISLDIVTPEKNIFSADVYYFHIPTAGGYIGVYPKHTALVAALDIGTLSVDDGEGNITEIFISGGFLEIGNDKAVVLAKSAEKKEDIDVERAKMAKERAEKRLAGNDGDIDRQRAEAALKRALNRLKIAE